MIHRSSGISDLSLTYHFYPKFWRRKSLLIFSHTWRSTAYWIDSSWASAWDAALKRPSLKVLNDITVATDTDNATMLMLLDPSAVFDSVDHFTLLYRCEFNVRLHVMLLKWFKSYLTEQYQFLQVSNNCILTPMSPVKYGVPHRSVLGPFLFSLYMLLLGNIMRKHNISYHYADDTQIYISITPNDTASIVTCFNKASNCFNKVKTWMTENLLSLRLRKRR